MRFQGPSEPCMSSPNNGVPRTLWRNFPRFPGRSFGVAGIGEFLGQHRIALESALIACTAVTIGLSQALYNLILNNPEHFPTSGLFFIYVMAAVQVVPILLVAGMDLVLRRFFGNPSLLRLWRTFLFLFVAGSAARQAQLLSVEPVGSLIEQLADAHRLVWVLSVLALLAAFWYGNRLLTSFFVFLAPLALVLTGLFAYQSGLFGAAWGSADVADGGVASNERGLIPSELPPIFIIMWDELEYDEMVKDGRIDAQFVPNFADLANESIWFPNAQTNSRDTNIAIMTFLKGSPPGGRELSGPNLFERLADYYHLNLYEEKTVLARQFGCVNPRFSCRGELFVRTQFPLSTARWSMTQLVNLLVPNRVLKSIQYFPNSYEPQTSRVLSDIREKGGPGELFYWHVILPHEPYVFNPDGTKHKPNVKNAYRLQVQYVDMLLGQLLSTLKSEKLYDNSIIVVTSDHGLNNPCPCPIPLMIRAPNQPLGTSDADYSHEDFLPTLFDLLNVPLDADETVKGESIFASGNSADLR